jgi:hypothetical protein
MNHEVDFFKVGSKLGFMRRPAPTTCPACSARMRIARLQCDACGTAIEGDFDAGRLGRLSREQLAFVEVFLECRGKIKDVEQQLGLSYPTVVARLDQVVEAMVGPAREPSRSDDGARKANTEEVLDALSRGELTAAEAAARLRKNK